jgi:hypothetical protein
MIRTGAMSKTEIEHRNLVVILQTSMPVMALTEAPKGVASSPADPRNIRPKPPGSPQNGLADKRGLGTSSVDRLSQQVIRVFGHVKKRPGLLKKSSFLGRGCS